MLTIGLLGQSRTGKDTVGKILTDLRGGRSIALANKIKAFAQDVFGFSGEALYGSSELRNSPDVRFNVVGNRHWQDAKTNVQQLGRAWIEDILPYRNDHGNLHNLLRKWFLDVADHTRSSVIARLTPRYVLQTLGTEWGRTIDKYVWVENAMREAAANSSKFAVFTDVRFENEVRYLKRHGQPVWWVSRPNLKPLPELEHASETEQAQLEETLRKMCDAEIINNGTPEQLTQIVEHTLWESGL